MLKNTLYLKTLLVGVFSIFLFSGCFPNDNYTPVVKQKKPGLYGTKGWSYGQCYFGGGGLGDCFSKDIDGKVGYRLFVNGPRSTCEPDGSWTSSSVVIDSGSLPPGLSLNSKFHIEGIPQKRGHWIVKLRIQDMYCSGKKFYGIKQELRFHITGSGKVNY